MTSILAAVDRHHRGVIAALALLILFLAAACTFDGAIPICHYLFGCDHAVHAVNALGFSYQSSALF